MECHGITDARKIIGAKNRDTQSIVVSDGDGEVILEVSSSWPSGMNTTQARYVSQLLMESAQRVDNAHEDALRAIEADEAAEAAKSELPQSE